MADSKNNWHDAGRNCRSYLLRCWQEEELPDGEEPDELLTWRFALVPIDDEPGAKGFACLEDLFGYLHGQLIQAGHPAIHQGESTTVWPKLTHPEISNRKNRNES